jgi:hypothetical protein
MSQANQLTFRGNVRRTSGGIDAAVVIDNQWYKIQDSPLKSAIKDIYGFLMSPQQNKALFGKIYTKKYRKYPNNKIVSVSVSLVLVDIELSRYLNNPDGSKSDYDRCSLSLVFPAISASSDKMFSLSTERGYESQAS